MSMIAPAGYDFPRLRFVGILAVSAALGAGAAFSNARADDTSSAAFVSRCSGNSIPETCVADLAFAQAFAHDDPKVPKNCMPMPPGTDALKDNEELAQRVFKIVPWLKAHPEYSSTKFLHGLGIAMAAVYPCGVKPAVTVMAGNHAGLSFALVAEDPSKAAGPPLQDAHDPNKTYPIERYITQPGDVESAAAATDGTGMPVLEIHLTAAAAARTAADTSIVGRLIAFVLNGKTVLSEARVMTPLGSDVQLRGNFTTAEINDLVKVVDKAQPKSESQARRGMARRRWYAVAVSIAAAIFGGMFAIFFALRRWPAAP